MIHAHIYAGGFALSHVHPTNVMVGFTFHLINVFTEVYDQNMKMVDQNKELSRQKEQNKELQETVMKQNKELNDLKQESAMQVG